MQSKASKLVKKFEKSDDYVKKGTLTKGNGSKPHFMTIMTNTLRIVFEEQLREKYGQALPNIFAVAAKDFARVKGWKTGNELAAQPGAGDDDDSDDSDDDDDDDAPAAAKKKGPVIWNEETVDRTEVRIVIRVRRGCGCRCR